MSSSDTWTVYNQANVIHPTIQQAQQNALLQDPNRSLLPSENIFKVKDSTAFTTPVPSFLETEDALRMESLNKTYHTIHDHWFIDRLAPQKGVVNAPSLTQSRKNIWSTDLSLQNREDKMKADQGGWIVGGEEPMDVDDPDDLADLMDVDPAPPPRVLLQREKAYRKQLADEQKRIQKEMAELQKRQRLEQKQNEKRDRSLKPMDVDPSENDASSEQVQIEQQIQNGAKKDVEMTVDDEDNATFYDVNELKEPSSSAMEEKEQKEEKETKEQTTVLPVPSTDVSSSKTPDPVAPQPTDENKSTWESNVSSAKDWMGSKKPTASFPKPEPSLTLPDEINAEQKSTLESLATSAASQMSFNKPSETVEKKEPVETPIPSKKERTITDEVYNIIRNNKQFVKTLTDVGTKLEDFFRTSFPNILNGTEGASDILSTYATFLNSSNFYYDQYIASRNRLQNLPKDDLTQSQSVIQQNIPEGKDFYIPDASFVSLYNAQLSAYKSYVYLNELGERKTEEQKLLQQVFQSVIQHIDWFFNNSALNSNQQDKMQQRAQDIEGFVQFKSLDRRQLKYTQERLISALKRYRTSNLFEVFESRKKSRLKSPTAPIESSVSDVKTVESIPLAQQNVGDPNNPFVRRRNDTRRKAVHREVNDANQKLISDFYRDQMQSFPTFENVENEPNFKEKSQLYDEKQKALRDFQDAASTKLSYLIDRSFLKREQKYLNTPELWSDEEKQWLPMVAVNRQKRTNFKHTQIRIDNQIRQTEASITDAEVTLKKEIIPRLQRINKRMVELFPNADETAFFDPTRILSLLSPDKYAYLDDLPFNLQASGQTSNWGRGASRKSGL